MEKASSSQKNIYVQNHAHIAPADCHVNIEYFVHVSWWRINYRSNIHNWVTYKTKSHSPLWHMCCCIACILRLLYIRMWQTIHVTWIWKLHSWQFILLQYSPFLHIYCLVSCWLTSAIVMYITVSEVRQNTTQGNRNVGMVSTFCDIRTLEMYVTKWIFKNSDLW